MDLQMKRIRESKGFSQKKVASAIGVPVRRYGSWERQERNINLEDACKVADVLECTLDELAGRDFTPDYEYGSPAQEFLNQKYDSFNIEGKEKLVSYATDLAGSGKYEKSMPDIQVLETEGEVA